MTLNELAAEYAAAKAFENAAIAHRREVASAIVAATGHDSEGQKTYEDSGWKVTVKAPLIRSMDWKQWATVKRSIPQALWPIKVKEELDDEGVQWIAENDKEIWKILAPCLTTKPGAVQVTVKPVEG